MPNYLALVPAAGTGSRIGGGMPKQYQSLGGRPMLFHALRALHRHPRIARVHVVLSRDDAWFERFDWREFGEALDVLRCGGDSRARSVLNGLLALSGKVGADDRVLVHDAARPCLTPAAIDRLIAEAGDDPAGGLLAEPLADTLKRAGDDGRIVRTEPREGLWRAQTPQMFGYALLLKALQQGTLEGVTDEASAVERLGLRPRLVRSGATNLKVTYGEDLRLAEQILQSQAGQA
ncbi:MAG TPA: 2-C-methyl-D-erythritol 4-phosphate cytidylyltransferase [Burkholderiales bacterium]|jgi:2-C-methyl-D-erythritol 4-phosphate cytidylyltransferase|nr:2-C-methyl-D-erythritol 4-phosphate cytidylyltransferase [Burkholderiales bacterium]